MAGKVCEICGAKVTEWSARYEANVVHCKKCFKSPEAKEYIAKKQVDNEDIDPSMSNIAIEIKSESPLKENDTEYSLLSLVFFFLSGISLFVGLVLCAKLWPSDPGYGKEWKTFAYIPAITWFTAGLVQFVLFAAFGQELHYLKQIASNTQKPNKSIQPTDNADLNFGNEADTDSPAR